LLRFLEDGKCVSESMNEWFFLVPTLYLRLGEPMLRRSAARDAGASGTSAFPPAGEGGVVKREAVHVVHDGSSLVLRSVHKQAFCRPTRFGWGDSAWAKIRARQAVHFLSSARSAKQPAESGHPPVGLGGQRLVRSGDRQSAGKRPSFLPAPGPFL